MTALLISLALGAPPAGNDAAPLERQLAAQVPDLKYAAYGSDPAFDTAFAIAWREVSGSLKLDMVYVQRGGATRFVATNGAGQAWIDGEVRPPVGNPLGVARNSATRSVLEDARSRVVVLMPSTPDADRIAAAFAATGGKARGLAVWNARTGRGVADVQGKTVSVRVEYGREGELLELLEGMAAVEGLWIVGPRGTVITDPMSGTLRVRLRDDWKRLTPRLRGVSDGDFVKCDLDRVATVAAGPAGRLLPSGVDSAALIEQVAFPPEGAELRVDPLVWLLR